MLRLLVLAFATVGLVACGSTSDLSGLNTDSGTEAVSLANYNRVVVREFSNKMDDSSDSVQLGTVKFAEYIATDLRSNPAFSEVVLEKDGVTAKITPQTLIVDGDVNRYVEGNQTLRMLVGMGAGSSYFAATVNVSDAMTHKVLARSKVDLNSWALGGVIAANQTVDSFMVTSAAKVANDVVAAKNGTLKTTTTKVAESNFDK